MRKTAFNTTSKPTRDKIREIYNQTEPVDLYNTALHCTGLDHSLIVTGFKKWVRQDTSGNLVLPHWDKSGVCGLFLQNGLTQHLSTPDGLWLARDHAQSRQIVIANTAIETMSYSGCDASVYGQSLFVSPNADMLSQKQAALLQRTVQTMKNRAVNPLEKIIIALGNDEAGVELAEQIEKCVRSSDVPVHRDLPEIHITWNHFWIDLLVRKNKSFGAWVENSFCEAELKSIAHSQGQDAEILHAQSYMDVLYSRFERDIWNLLMDSMQHSDAESVYEHLSTYGYADYVYDHGSHERFLIQYAAFHTARDLLARKANNTLVSEENRAVPA